MRKLLVLTLLLALPLAAQTTHRKPAAKAETNAEPMPAVTEPTAVIDTSAGRMTCVLYPNKAPNSVANFAALAEGKKTWKDPKTGKPEHKPLYDGTIFHRVIPNFMIQGGDPLGNGTGGPGYEINDEISDLKFDTAGRLAYANAGPNTNGSQFFITEAPTPWLDGHYTILGQCDSKTVDLVKNIARRARDERNDHPFDPVVVSHITILGYQVPGTESNVAKKPRHTVAKKKPQPQSQQ